MRIAIIADDLTGANDTGVQMAKLGVPTSVLLDYDEGTPSNAQVVVFDTDSRAMGNEQSYKKVFDMCANIKNQYHFDILYKKIDSTLRGNIGSEMDAMYDIFKPDFIVLAPSFPKFGRVLRNGQLFINEIPLHETGMANDPKNPINESNVINILRNQSKKPNALITREQLYEDSGRFLYSLNKYHTTQIPYLICDAETDRDLTRLIQLFNQTDYKVIWSGSAALAHKLSIQHFSHKNKPKTSLPVSGKTCIVVGSINTQSHAQLCHLLQRTDVLGVNVNSVALLSEETKLIELERIKRVISNNDSKSNIAIYLNNQTSVVEETRRVGSELGINPLDISDIISESLGEIASEIIVTNYIRSLVLTGGDTARQVCHHLGAKEIELIDEIEVGVPIGRLTVDNDVYAVITKAGGFGSERVLELALEAFARR